MGSILTIVFVTAASADAGWIVAKRDGAALIERRPHAGGIMEIRASVETDVAAEIIAEAYWYPERQPVDAVKKRIVLKHNDNEQIIYQQVKLPMVKDRDYTLRIERYVDASNGLHQFIGRCDSAAGPAEHGAYVRVHECRSEVSIERLANGRTLLTYVAFANPAGNVPAWIVNMVAPNAAKDVLNGLLSGARVYAKTRGALALKR